MVRAWVEDLRTSTQTSGLFAELSQITPMFESYLAYEQAFPLSSTASPPDGGDADGDAALAEPQGTVSDAVDEAKKFKNLASHATIDFSYDLLAGVHDGAIKEAALASSMQAAKWVEPENARSSDTTPRLSMTTTARHRW